MMFLRVIGGLWLTALSLSAQAQPWEFSAPILVTDTQGPGIFHHLESSGRHNIAVSAGTVAVAWEDNHDGMPRIYLARKAASANAFTPALQISGSGEAFEPSLLALDNERFVLAWEEDARIHVRLVTPTELGPESVLGGEGMQASLGAQGNQVLLVYSQREGRVSRIWLQRLNLDGLEFSPGRSCAVDSEPAQDEQLYPTLVSLDNDILVAWEDRRFGHTVIMATRTRAAERCGFVPPQRISEGRAARNLNYGKGHGVARVALARYGAQQAFAVWADKRDFREGYDIYGADYQADGPILFGANQKVQDSFGGVAQQWHASVAGDAAGQLVVAWDDNRDGDANIMYSWRENGEWSDDLVVPGAGGAGQQNHPSVILDPAGNLHLAWVARASIDGATTLHYVFGRTAAASVTPTADPAVDKDK